MSSMTLAQQIITIGMCILGTMATRYLPFLIFKENKKTRCNVGVILIKMYGIPLVKVYLIIERNGETGRY